MEKLMDIPQAVNVLYQAVLMGQRAGIYSFNDSVNIKFSLDSLRIRLGLDENLKPVASSSGENS